MVTVRLLVRAGLSGCEVLLVLCQGALHLEKPVSMGN